MTAGYLSRSTFQVWWCTFLNCLLRFVSTTLCRLWIFPPLPIPRDPLLETLITVISRKIICKFFKHFWSRQSRNKVSCHITAFLLCCLFRFVGPAALALARGFFFNSIIFFLWVLLLTNNEHAPSSGTERVDRIRRVVHAFEGVSTTWEVVTMDG